MKSKHTDEQLNWLRSRLPEYENRAAAQVRGDAKGFALKCAEEYIEKWGLGTGPDAEKESQVKEVSSSPALRQSIQLMLIVVFVISEYTPGRISRNHHEH